MGFSDEQIRKIVALKDELHSQISEHQEKIEILGGNLEVLDMILKESSFTKASSLITGHTTEPSPSSDSIPITGGGGGKVLARAHVTPDRISIIPDPDTRVRADTPPFKSFFLDRIIEGMKRKDISESEEGKIQPESIIDCTIKEKDTYIGEITVRNYRQKERVTEIISTMGWSLTRMLENIKK